MCIIAYKPEGVTLPESHIDNMWEGNPHGAGFMYAENGQVKIVKGFMSLKAFKAAYEAHKDRALVMHFRIRTHGDVSPNLTHPFWVRKDGVAMVHNGIIYSAAQKATATESDTLVFARALGKRFDDPMSALGDPTILRAIEDEIGYSKLVFLDGTGKIVIVKENLGQWTDGVWYSNSGFKSYGSGWWGSRYAGYMDGGAGDEWEGYGTYSRSYTPPGTNASDERELAIARARREQEYQELFAEFFEKEPDEGEDVGQDFPSDEVEFRNAGFSIIGKDDLEAAGLDHESPSDVKFF